MNQILWKKTHNWAGILSAVFLTVLLLTGLLLNHPSPLKKNVIATLQTHPLNSNQLYRGGSEGFFRSNDGGATWEEVPMLYPPQEVVSIAFSPENPETIFLLEKWGRILKSPDGGKIWNALPIPFDPQSEGIEQKQLSVGPRGEIVLLTSHGWLKTQNDGQSWDETYFHKKERPLYRLVLTLHNGYFFGPSFVWFYDFAAVSLLLLIITGFILWYRSRTIA